MTLANKIALKENRLTTLKNSEKENSGVQKRLEREIRNLESKVK